MFQDADWSNCIGQRTGDSELANYGSNFGYDYPCVNSVNNSASSAGNTGTSGRGVRLWDGSSFSGSYTYVWQGEWPNYLWAMNDKPSSHEWCFC